MAKGVALGETFGRLTVIGFVWKGGKKLALCTCACGNPARAEPNLLRRGLRVSCGCLRGGDRRSPRWRETYGFVRGKA